MRIGWRRRGGPLGRGTTWALRAFVAVVVAAVAAAGVWGDAASTFACAVAVAVAAVAWALVLDEDQQRQVWGLRNRRRTPR